MMAIATVLLKVGGHMQLVVTRDWYVKYLEMKVVHESAGRNVFLEHGAGARLALHIGELAGNPAAVSLYIEVSDVDALYGRLSREGVPFDVTPSDRPTWGGRVAALGDPVGHVVKFFEPMERPARDQRRYPRRRPVGGLPRVRVIRRGGAPSGPRHQRRRDRHPGLRALAEVLVAEGHEVFVVAPNQDMTAYGTCAGGRDADREVRYAAVTLPDLPTVPRTR